MNLMICILFSLKSLSSVSEVPMTEVRSLFMKSVDDARSCQDLLKLLENYDEIKNPTLAGYKASAWMIMAKHSFNPMEKLSFFNKGKTLMESCIQASPENIELHFLRFSIQCNSPDFLGYNDSLMSDKSFLLKSINKKADKELNSIILSYMNVSEYLTIEEKQLLKS